MDPADRGRIASVIVDCAIYRDGNRADTPPGFAGGTPTADLSDALDKARAEGGSFVWIGLYEPTEEEFDLVTAEFGLHPLAVEDALTAHQRPKLEVYEDSLFLVLKPVDYDDAADTVSAGELMVFVGDAFVVTVRHGHGIDPGTVRHRLETDPEVLRHGPSAVMYAICDTVVDHYLDVGDELQADLEELEAEVFQPDAVRPGSSSRHVGGSTASRIYGFKRQVLEFRRVTGPLAQPMSRLADGSVPFTEPRAQPFFRDVADHLIRVNEQVEGLDRLMSDILQAHLTQVSVRQNDDMRKISAWAAMAAAPTLIAGIYGMNFDHMPELHYVWAYPTVLAVTAGLVLALYRNFKHRGWL
jgi:magnesium transporter